MAGQPYPPGYEPFLQKIIETPTDNAPRLIFADWLDENGAAERAEFIRLQIEQADLQPDDPKTFDIDHRLRQMDEAKLCSEWSRHLPEAALLGHPAEYFHRGFFDTLHMTADELLVHAPSILQHEPVTAIQLRRPLIQSEAVQLAESEWLSKIHSLSLNNTRCGDAIANELISSQFLDSLKDLELADTSIDSECIANLQEFDDRLRTLDLSNNFLPNWYYQPLFSSPWSHLHRLNLSGNELPRISHYPKREIFANLKVVQFIDCGIDSENIDTIFEHRYFDNAEVLDLSFNRLESLNRLIWFSSIPIPNLRRLYLMGAACGDRTIRAFAAEEYWSNQLKLLSLSGNGVEGTKLNDESIAYFADGELIQNLHCLTLAHYEIGPKGWLALACQKDLPLLWRLDLSHNSFGDRWVEMMASARGLANLKWLSLASCGIQPQGIDALSSMPELSQLKYLNLSGNAIDSTGAQSLAESKTLRHDLILDVSNANMNLYDIAKLRERFPMLVCENALLLQIENQ